MTLVRLQARDAHDAERPACGRAAVRGGETLRVDAATNDDELSPRLLAVVAHQVLAVERRDDCDERRGREFLPEHRPVDEDVVRVSGEAERDARQAANDVRGQRRVCRPVCVHVLDMHLLGLAREPRGLGDNDPRTHEKPG